MHRHSIQGVMIRFGLIWVCTIRNIRPIIMSGVMPKLRNRFDFSDFKSNELHTKVYMTLKEKQDQKKAWSYTED